jgi:TRAP-type C4-dicarboxylate transport system permease small subunit
VVMNFVIWETFNILYSVKLPTLDIMQPYTSFDHGFMKIVLPILTSLLMIYFMIISVSARMPPLVAVLVNNEM